MDGLSIIGEMSQQAPNQLNRALVDRKNAFNGFDIPTFDPELGVASKRSRRIDDFAGENCTWFQPSSGDLKGGSSYGRESHPRFLTRHFS